MNITLTLSTAQAAARIGVTPATLRSWRFRGKGPAYHKSSPRRVFYLATDVDEWIQREGPGE